MFSLTFLKKKKIIINEPYYINYCGSIHCQVAEFLNKKSNKI